MKSRIFFSLLIAMMLSPGVYSQTITAGADDNFGGGADLASPSADLIRVIENFPAVTTNFDGLPHNQQVAHTFSGLPAGIVSGTLAFRVRGGFEPGVDGDGIIVSFVDATTTDWNDVIVWRRNFGTFGGGGSIFADPDPGLATPGSVWNSNSVALLSLDLAAMPLSDGGTLDLIPLINEHGFIDVSVGDDSVADFFRLDLTVGPDPGTFFIFPQFVDGKFPDDTFLRSTVLINERQGAATSCTLQLVGLTAGVENSVGSDFVISVENFAIVRTNGAQSIQTGYATLTCDTPVYANLIYSSYSPAGDKIAEATVFGSDPANAKSLVVDQSGGARVGVAIANDTNQAHTYTLSLETVLGTTQTAQVQIQAKASIAQFLDELILIPPDAERLFEIRSDDGSSFSAIGLRFTGAVFTTVPAN